VITGSSLPPVPRPKVHDAALRLRLLECAGATLSTRGLAALSLRTLAADVGTSTTAVYALFGGKPGLLAALHAEAFARLGPGWTPCRSVRTRWRTSSPSAAPTATPRSPTPTSTR
jgi:AcrR family transcriptional regulator